MVNAMGGQNQEDMKLIPDGNGLKDNDHIHIMYIRKVEHCRIRQRSCLPQENKQSGKKNTRLSYSAPQLNNVLL